MTKASAALLLALAWVGAGLPARAAPSIVAVSRLQGSAPAALVEDEGRARLVLVRDALAGSRVGAIDARGVKLRDGRRLALRPRGTRANPPGLLAGAAGRATYANARGARHDGAPAISVVVTAVVPSSSYEPPAVLLPPPASSPRPSFDCARGRSPVVPASAPLPGVAYPGAASAAEGC